MSLYSAAARTRPDILTACSYASVVTEPTESDDMRLNRIIGYLLGTFCGTKGLVRVNGNEYEHRCIVSNNHGKHTVLFRKKGKFHGPISSIHLRCNPRSTQIVRMSITITIMT